jgi:hypothetical protein
MAASKQKSPNADQLWAGEIKLTVHVPKELTPSEEQELTANLEDLAEKFRRVAQDRLPPGCRIDVQVG